jgi:iron complex outermembrane receptor protein
MTSAAAALAMGAVGGHAFAQTAAAPAATTDTQTVVVTGIRKSLQSALKQKKNNERTEEIITAEDVGKFPDKNVADSLSRATGVNVTTGSPTAGGFGENERVSIRGTDPELNLTLLDGHNMATGDWFVLDQTGGGRSFNYTMLPSEVVGTVEVIKSSSADLPEGGVGGTVDVHERNPLDLPANTVSGSVQALYATLADKVTPYASGMYSWRNDARTFGVLFGAFYEQRDFRRDGQETLGYASVANFGGKGQTLYVPSLIGSAYFQQQRTREGGDLHAQWKPSDTLEFDFSGLYTYLKANNSNHNFMLDGSALSAAGNNANLASYTASGGYVTSASWNASSAEALVQDDIYRQSHSESYDVNIDGTWTPTEHWNVKGQIGFTAGTGTTDDSAAWETYWTNVGATYALGKPTAVSFPGLPAGDTTAAYLNNKFSWSWGGKVEAPDRELYGKFDIDYKIGNDLFHDVVFGARYTDHYRAVNDTAYAWSGNGANNGTTTGDLGALFTGDTTPSNYANGIGNIPGYSYTNEASVYNYLNSHNGGRQFAFYAPSSYAVREKTEAYYAMTKVGGDKWYGDIGVRAVDTHTTSIQYSASAPTITVSNVFGSWGQEDTKHDYWDILPSANFVYKASDSLLFRADAAKVMSRPSYSQLAGYFYLVDTNLTGGSGGNPKLDPYRAMQYNLSAEYYYGPDSLVSFGLFDLDVSNYITTEAFQGFYTDQKNPQGATFTMTGPANGGKAKTQGFEVNLQQPLSNGFGFIANATVASASAGLTGTSKLTYNLTGYYESGPISTRLSYNFRSHFYLGIANGSPDYQDDYGTLDGTFSYALTPHISLTVDAQNLLHEKLYYYDVTKNIPRAVYDNGQSFYAGVRFKY